VFNYPPSWQALELAEWRWHLPRRKRLNLFGTLTLVVDQPATVGDFCKIGEFMGTIQSIGLRSTRIRLPDDTLVTIPNGQISNAALTNISARGKILFSHIVPLTRATSSSQLQTVLSGIDELLRQRKDVDPETFRVRMLRIGSSSLDVELWAHLLTRDYREFLAKQEELLVSVLQIVEKSGTSLALPSQTLYVASQPVEPEQESGKSANSY
jgi:MscS family membrane protein